jgi:hypothetical protein
MSEAWVKEDIARWAKLVKETGAKVEQRRSSLVDFLCRSRGGGNP